MKINKLTGREIGMIIALAIILVGVLYYVGFYKPMQADLASIAEQTSVTDDQINTAMTKASNMKKMQEEVNEILSRPKFEITEIAPYDNKNVVLNILNGILGASQQYSLSFTDPDIQPDGTVRRDISMDFSCEDYNSAKVILRDLSKSNWRCLVKNVSIAANGTHSDDKNEEAKKKKAEAEDDEEAYDSTDIMMNPVKVTATITFFESTKLHK